MSKELIRCYQCTFYKGGQYNGKCVDHRPDKNGNPRKTIPVDAVDYCDDAVRKEEAKRE